ncbi:hypothetical protein FOVSG1_014143 [Fusarium oxysporum f. sp. vasinfectum]
MAAAAGSSSVANLYVNDSERSLGWSVAGLPTEPSRAKTWAISHALRRIRTINVVTISSHCSLCNFADARRGGPYSKALRILLRSLQQCTFGISVCLQRKSCMTSHAPI